MIRERRNPLASRTPVAGGVLAAVYVSFAIAPPLIGYLGDLLSLRVALLLVGVSGLGIVRVARAAV